MRRILFGVALALCAPAAIAPAARAAVTVGSPLTVSFSPTPSCLCTFTQTSLPESGARVTSPIDGVVVRWRVLDASGPLALRVLHPVGNFLTATGAGTSGTETPPDHGLQTFSTRLQIQAGDLVGYDATASSQIGFNSGVSGSGGEDWNPPLADGETRSIAGGGQGELAYNADVEADADHDGFGDETQDKCVGTAGTFSGCPSAVTIDSAKQKGRKPKIKVTSAIPGAGTLRAGSANDASLASASAKVSLKAVSKTITSTSRQQVTLTLKLTKSARQKLASKGKLKARVKVVYTPPGGPAASQTGKVKLID